jgi:hypothetical protein
MIHSEAEFEATLEEVAGLLDRPFQEEERTRLHALMRDLERYRPSFTAEPPESGLAEQSRRLRQHLADFEERVGSRHPSVMGDLAVALGLYQETDLHDLPAKQRPWRQSTE